MKTRHPLALVAALIATAILGVGSPATSSPASEYVGPHFGKGNIPAGCIADRDPMNPDNLCYHMKVGLNALDTPKVDVDIVVPVSPDAERDMRMAEQAVDMWNGGIHYLSQQMDMPWLTKGFEMNIRTHEVLTNPDGTLAEPLNLVDPEIVVVLSNPAGGIGIGIDPLATVGTLGISNGGVPCTATPSTPLTTAMKNPFSLKQWQHTAGFQQHGGEQGGIYVEDCDGVGGNVCFAVNGAVDPVPGASDFFPVFDLISHEFGHCLTLGHVGDGADGPWGPTPTNDIMAYSTDPPGIAKCVSTLDVEGFALRMSNYLDVNHDGKVDAKDKITPNDPEGDGSNSFEVQNPNDHYYASATGSPLDCPQPNYSVVPGSYAKTWMPKPVATTRTSLKMGKASVRGGRLTVSGVARNVPLAKQPTKTSGSVKDATSDTPDSYADITGMSVRTSKNAVDATIKVSQLLSTPVGSSVPAYSLLVSGRRFDSFQSLASTGSVPKVMDNGTGYYLPDGTAKWDAAKGTVTFHIRRDYLADQHIYAPYHVNAITGLHSRSNDWIATLDSAPDKAGLFLAAPKMGKETRDAPVDTKRETIKTTLPGGTFVPSDSTLGVGLVSTVDNRDYLTLPIKKQSTVTVTLKSDSTSYLGLSVNGGSSQQVKRDDATGTVTVTVPWARRDLSLTVDPEEIYAPTSYTISAVMTTKLADKDKDGVPDVADACKAKRGPSLGGGCPDSDGDGMFDKNDACPKAASISANGCPTKADERVYLYVDGKRVASTTVVTKHGSMPFALRAPASAMRGKGKHTVALVWKQGGKVMAREQQRMR